MRIFAIRHLMTQWNKLKLLQGRSDQSILYPDEEELLILKENVKQIKEHGPFDKVLTSSLKRTFETAFLYGYDSAKVNKEPLLDELDFGKKLEGESREGITDIWETALKKEQDLIFGESMERFASRVKQFIEKYKEYKTLLVFGHGVWLRALISLSRHGDLNHLAEVNLKNNQLFICDVNIEAFSSAVLENER